MRNVADNKVETQVGTKVETQEGTKATLETIKATLEAIKATLEAIKVVMEAHAQLTNKVTPSLLMDINFRVAPK